MTAFYGLVLSLFFLSACEVEASADVNQERIYADYKVFYNSNTDKTWVIARFRFGGPTGTLLELNALASVSFDGDELLLGPSNLFIDRSTEVDISEGTSEGGKIRGKYRAPNKTVPIIE